MAVRDGHERRHVSASAETWEAIDALAAEAGVPRFTALRAVLESGLRMVTPDVLVQYRGEALQFEPGELDHYRATYRRIIKGG